MITIFSFNPRVIYSLRGNQWKRTFLYVAGGRSFVNFFFCENSIEIDLRQRMLQNIKKLVWHRTLTADCQLQVAAC